MGRLKCRLFPPVALWRYNRKRIYLDMIVFFNQECDASRVKSLAAPSTPDGFFVNESRVINLLLGCIRVHLRKIRLWEPQFCIITTSKKHVAARLQSKQDRQSWRILQKDLLQPCEVQWRFGCHYRRQNHKRQTKAPFQSNQANPTEGGKPQGAREDQPPFF